MRRLVLVAALLGVLAPGAGAQSFNQLGDAVKAYVTVSDPVIALKGVRVIDGTGAAPAENQTVLIENGRIKAVGSASSVTVPANAKVMDLAGHTVVPGFVGMHDHIHYSAAGWRNINLSFSSPRLYLAAGVTTIRTTGSLVPYEDMNLKQDIDAGKSPGPRMNIYGPYITDHTPALPVMA